MAKLAVIIERDANSFFVHVPALPGCHTQGRSAAEALANIREAATLYMETLSARQRRRLPSVDVSTATIEVVCRRSV